jgi:hypothetical protein
MLPLLSGMAGGGLSTSNQTNVSSRSGDIRSPFDAAFDYDGTFIVGGTQSRSVGFLSGGGGMLWVALALAAVGVVFVLKRN